MNFHVIPYWWKPSLKSGWTKNLKWVIIYWLVWLSSLNETGNELASNSFKLIDPKITSSSNVMIHAEKWRWEWLDGYSFLSTSSSISWPTMWVVEKIPRYWLYSPKTTQISQQAKFSSSFAPAKNGGQTPKNRFFSLDYTKEFDTLPLKSAKCNSLEHNIQENSGASLFLTYCAFEPARQKFKIR